MSLTGFGEFSLIRKIKEKVGDSGLLIGIGDDTAAALPTPGMALLATADLLAEGVHFDLSWHLPKILGRKSLAVNLSDIAAMGGIPRHALLSLALPKDVSTEFVDSFIEGFLEIAAEHGVTLAGGDTSASKGGLFINVTMLGEQFPELVVRRSGAKAGDLIFMSGTAGDSALGLRLLRGGSRDGSAVKCHTDPVPRLLLGRILAERRLATAMIDVSDGIASDLGHILEQSKVGGILNLAHIPRSVEFKKIISVDSDGYNLLPLTGGEDYELLFTVAPENQDKIAPLAVESGVDLTCVGIITAGSGLVLASDDGSSCISNCRGYDHFK